MLLASLSYATLIQPVLWVIFGGAAIYFASRGLLARKRKLTTGRSFKYAIAAFLAALIVVPTIGVVPAGYRGVVYRWNGGVDPSPRGEGVTFIWPWIQHLTTSTVRTQKVFSDKIFAQSADLQEITVVASVNFHVLPAKTPYLYQHVGPNYSSVIVQPALFQRTKAAVGQIKAIDFAVERDNLARTIQRQLTTQLAGYGIVVEYVNIEDAIFDPAFVAAVKAKVIAKQQAQQQRNLIAKQAALKTQTIINAQATARSVLIQATAQAKANRLIAASTLGINVQVQWIAKWDGTLPTTLLAGGQTNPFILNLPTP